MEDFSLKMGAVTTKTSTQLMAVGLNTHQKMLRYYNRTRLSNSVTHCNLR